MIEKINEKVLLGVVIVGLGAIGLELKKMNERLKKMNERLDNQFNHQCGYYTDDELCREDQKYQETVSILNKKEDK